MQLVVLNGLDSTRPDCSLVAGSRQRRPKDGLVRGKQWEEGGW
jgi:hypothetical protein